jgi:hypothetical protein
VIKLDVTKMLTTIETTGTVTDGHSITLDQELPLNDQSRVKVIVLFGEENGEDIDEKEWSQFLSSNEAFDFLSDDGEDIYTLEDGESI